MRYARLVNNEIEELNQSYIKHNGKVYTNTLHNDQIDIAELGYKEFVVDEMPQYDQVNQKVVRYYQVVNNIIHRSWEVQDLTDEEKQMREKMMGV